MSEKHPQRVIVFGAAGYLGQEVVARLDDLPWSDVEVIGVASEASSSVEYEFRGELLDAVTAAPTLRQGDLVFACTPRPVAMDIVRSALQAQATCIDCSGVMAEQAEVPMPVLAKEFAGDSSAIAQAPLLAQPGATTIAWAPLLDALSNEPGVSRVVGTILRSASAHGRRGLVALSEESIALFNQSEAPGSGPAGQGVAFDVIPDRDGESRTAAELARVFDSKIRLDVMSVQVPTFVGEGASIAIELSASLEEAEIVKRLEGIDGLSIVDEGLGTRGLTAVEAGLREPTGPTLRDSAGAEETLVGGLRPDASLPAGMGWRLWLSYDPLRLAANHAIRLALLRFPAS
jgi:aspartate-semialdehyde dehydrogenase